MGPGPGRARPLGFPDPGFLLLLMRSSRVISRDADMFCVLSFYLRRRERGEAEKGYESERARQFRVPKARDRERKADKNMQRNYTAIAMDNTVSQ